MQLLRFPFRAEGDVAGAAAGAAAKGGVESAATEPAKGAADEAAALRAKVAEYEAKEAKRVAAEKKAADDAAKARGDHERLLAEREAEAKTLAEKLKGYEEREAARIAKVDAANAKRIKEIPEIRRTLVPAEITGDALDVYLTTNWSLLKGDDVATGTRTATGTAPGVRLTKELIADAQKHNMDPEKWAEILTKAGRLKPANA